MSRFPHTRLKVSIQGPCALLERLNVMMNWSLPSLVLPFARRFSRAIANDCDVWELDFGHFRLSIDCGGRCLRLREADERASHVTNQWITPARNGKDFKSASSLRQAPLEAYRIGSP